LILSFRRVHNVVVSFLLGDSPASVFYMPTFRNSLSVPSSCLIVYKTRHDFRSKSFERTHSGKYTSI
jgi:hypothetical protein